jgi:mRNA degradation ribonuclease J1/J2
MGFDNFIIGRLPKALLPLVQPSLQKANRRGLTPTFWAKSLSYELILFTHKQWSYRKGTVHYNPSEGKMVKEHLAMEEQVKSILTLPPESLLPHHRHLLSPTYAQKLGKDSSTSKQFCIVEVQAALYETSIIHSLKNCTVRKEKAYVYRNKVKTPVDSISSPSSIEEATLPKE